MRTTYQRGQVYPLFALMLTALIGVSALSVDVGYYRYQQRLQQTAADSAALAAAQASDYDSTNSSNYLNAARADAANNGFTNGSGNVTVDATPTMDPFTGSDGGMKATITKAYPKFFGAIFGGGSRTIATSAVARLQEASGACLTTLNNNGTSLSTINGGSIAASQCSIANNGCTSVTGASGGKVVVDSWSVNAASKSCSTWKPNNDSQYQYSLPVVDPCSLTTQCNTLATASASSLGLSSDFKTCTNPSTASGTTLNGGCYNNLTFDAQKTWTLNPGIYVLTGNVSFNKGTVNGTGGVTIYLAKGATYTDSSNMTLNLTAPSGSGDFVEYADGENGMVFYQAPAAAYTVTMAANVNIIGMAYLPDWDVTFTGHTQGFTGSLVVDTATVKGAGTGSQLTLNPGTGSTPAAGAKIPVLVE